MAAIYINDFDNRIVDAIAEADFDFHDKCQDDARRQTCVHNVIMEAFQTVAGDDKDVRHSDVWASLMSMADTASMQWVQKFSSRADRCVVLRRMFPIAMRYIDTIPMKEPKPMPLVELLDYDEGFIIKKDYHGFNGPSGSTTKNIKLIDPDTLKRLADTLKRYKNNP